MSGLSMFMLDPTARARTPDARLAERQDDVRGLTIGFVDNGWWSFGVVIERYRQLLAERFGIQDVIHYKKISSRPLSDEMIEELRTKCRVIVSGLGN